MVMTLLFLTGISLLSHEYLKEGYFFDLQDILVPRFTHEKAIVIVVAVAILFALRKRNAQLS